MDFRERRQRELRRTPLLGTWVNKGKKKGRRIDKPWPFFLRQSWVRPFPSAASLRLLRGFG